MVLGVSIERTIAVAWALSITITTVGGMLLAMSSGGASISIKDTGIIILAAVVFAVETASTGGVSFRESCRGMRIRASRCVRCRTVRTVSRR